VKKVKSDVFGHYMGTKLNAMISKLLFNKELRQKGVDGGNLIRQITSKLRKEKNMPDDCRNLLKLEGDGKEMKRFIKQARNTYVSEENRYDVDLSFQKFMPIPEEYSSDSIISIREGAELIVKYGYDNPIDWCNGNWGVETDAQFSSYDQPSRMYSFITDYDPPVKAILTISKQFPMIKFTLEYKNFRHEDREVADYGKLKVMNGNIQSEEYSKIRCMVCEHCGTIYTYMKLG